MSRGWLCMAMSMRTLVRDAEIMVVALQTICQQLRHLNNGRKIDIDALHETTRWFTQQKKMIEERYNGR